MPGRGSARLREGWRCQAKPGPGRFQLPQLPTFSSRAMSPLGVSTARLKKQTPPMADTPCRKKQKQQQHHHQAGDTCGVSCCTNRRLAAAAPGRRLRSRRPFARGSVASQRLHAHLKVDALLATLLERSLQAQV